MLIIEWEASSVFRAIIDVQTQSLIAGQLWKLESC